MTVQHAHESELVELLNALCEDTLTREDAARLEQLVRGNPEMRERYLAYMYLDATLRWERPAGIPQGADALDLQSNTAIVPPGIPIGEPLPASPSNPFHTVPGLTGYFSSGWPVAYLIATVLFTIGLTVAAIIHVSQPSREQQLVAPSPNPRSAVPNPASIVARVTGMVDCEWEGTGFGVQGSGAANQKSEIRNQKFAIRLGDRLALRSGLLEVTYETGARVILQGPVTYEVESPSGGYLAIGKLTARLEKKVARGQWSVVSGQNSASHQPLATNHSPNPQSLIPNPLFSVRTPTAIVTDLGTEFGVEVGKDGDTTSHVFRGSVEMRTISANETAPKVRVLHAAESARVESAAGAGHERTLLLVPGAKAGDFVRVLPNRAMKTLDLADVVAGGDGFSGNRNRGIDPTTGRPVAGRLEPKALVGDGRYHPVQGLPFVDGVFIPYGRRPVQTDSAGHTFDAFGNAFHETWTGVWAGGPIPVNARGQASPTLLGGVDYGSPDHGLLYMHANQGITFDLEAIRRANPGYKLVRFRTVVGNTETAAVAPPSDDAVLKTTLFSDDFQSAAVGASPDLAPASVDPVTGSRVVGTWNLHKGIDVPQVRNNLDPGDPKSVPGANKYLAFTRYAPEDTSFALATGWAASSTEEQIVQLTFSMYVPSKSAGDVFGVSAFTDGVNAGGRTVGIIQCRNGEVKFHDGIDWRTTPLHGKTDVWQYFVITADMAAKKYTINLDGKVFRDAYWDGNATSIACLYMSRPMGATGSSGFIDNLRLQAFPKPSASAQSDPNSASADAWILVDGERRSGRRGMNRDTGSASLVIPIAERDRFLTLVATDGDNGLYWDSVLFADPQLELAPTAGAKQ